jgi:DNA (cytosine-5)-methyltransferase 1
VTRTFDPAKTRTPARAGWVLVSAVYYRFGDMQPGTDNQRSARPPLQSELAFPERALLEPGERLAILDLFAGIGGMSEGFHEEGFEVIGVDREPVACEFFQNAGLGEAREFDLGQDLVSDVDVPVVIGGPPCRPWSPVNLQRRRNAHADHHLLSRFVDNVLLLGPKLFIMENVPALGSDPLYHAERCRLRDAGYSVARRLLHYERFGAATRRRRLFTVGVKGADPGAEAFFRLLDEEQRAPGTVREAIEWLRDTERDGWPDHDWSELRSIGNYRERYESGRFGWRRLEYDEPAPSFGSVAKTYILHPEAGKADFPERVLSVREVMSIMGFRRDVRFPEGTARARRYQMIANAVSPCVSRAVARAAKRILRGDAPVVPVSGGAAAPGEQR